jgi:regulatory protein
MRFSMKEALQKAAHYCARQERCHQEVKDKLFQWGILGNEAEEVIAELISGNYLNEQRFAEAFAIGKLRQKYWGKQRIKAGLLRKRVAMVCIDEALSRIDDDEYQQVLLYVAQKRSRQEKAINPFTAKQRIIRYLVQRGFEPDLARAVMDSEKLND